MSVGHFPNAEWEAMEENAHRCRRVAAALRYDLERQGLPRLKALAVRIRILNYEERATKIEADLKKARGY